MKSHENRNQIASISWMLSITVLPILSSMTKGEVKLLLMFISVLGWFVTSIYIGHLNDESAKASQTRSSGCFLTLALLFGGAFLYLAIGALHGCSPY